MPVRPKVRDVVDLLHALGWRATRQRGSHRTFAAPDGRTVQIVVNHPNAEADHGVLRALRRVGVPLR